MKLLMTILLMSAMPVTAQAQSLFDEPAPANDVPYASSLDEEAAQAQYAQQVQAAAGGERVYFLQTIDDLQSRVDTLEDQIQYMGNVVAQQQEQITTYQGMLEQREQAASEAQDAADQAAAAAQDRAAQAPANAAAVQPRTSAPAADGYEAPADDAAGAPQPAE